MLIYWRRKGSFSLLFHKSMLIHFEPSTSVPGIIGELVRLLDDGAKRYTNNIKPCKIDLIT